MDGFVVEGLEEGGVVGGDEVDEVQLESFGVGVGLGVADGVFGGVGVAVAAGGVGAEEGRGVVLNLGFEDGSILLESEPSTMGWAAPALVPGAMAAMSADSRGEEAG